MNNIASLIRQIAQTGQRPTIIVGQVTARDDEARTIDVQPSDGSAPLLGVALQSSTEGTTGIVSYPAVGSTVAVAMLTGYDAGFCILTDEVERVQADLGKMSMTANADAVEIKADGTKATLTINADGTVAIDAKSITINGGKNGGLIQIATLMEAIKNLAQDIATVAAAVGSHIHAVSNASASPSNMRINLHNIAMSQSAYEDTKVKH